MDMPEPVRYYHTCRAPNPRRTDIFFAGKGVAFERVPVNLLEGAHRRQDDLDKINAGRIDDRWGELDRRLQGREWIAADRLTIADITALVSVDFLRILKREVPEVMTALRDWHARMRARPSASA